MMQGAMVPDADIAFNCAMIAHHQGAIEMAKVQLKHGKDEDAKKMAQRTIDQQSKEVEEMTKWGLNAKAPSCTSKVWWQKQLVEHSHRSASEAAKSEMVCRDALKTGLGKGAWIGD